MLDGRVGLVTGAARGIGRAIAIDLARNGARAVVVADIDEVSAAETVKAIEAIGSAALFAKMDARSSDDTKATVDECISAYGGIDILVNNVGITTSSLTGDLRIDVLPESVWEVVYETNLRSYFLMTKYAAPYLLASEMSPAIVNISSVASFVAYPGGAAYDATKAAVNQLTKNTALDLAPTVRCNCVCPGATQTDLITQYVGRAEDSNAITRATVSTHLVGRIAQPNDVVGLVSFLASDEASFITGAVIPVDGGSLAWRGSLQQA